jgi:PAS domain-containing protein
MANKTPKRYGPAKPKGNGRRSLAELEEKIRLLEQERDAALDRLQQAEKARWMLEALMEHIPEGITIAEGPAVRICLVSRYGQELTGRPAAELTDMRFPNMRPPGPCSVRTAPRRPVKICP